MESASRSSGGSAAPSKFDPKVIAAKPWKARPAIPTTFAQQQPPEPEVSRSKPQFYFGQQVAAVAKATTAAASFNGQSRPYANGNTDFGYVKYYNIAL